MVRSDSAASTRTFITPPPEPPKPTRPPRVKRDFTMPRIGLSPALTASRVIIILLLAVIVFLFVQYRDAKHKLTNSASNNQITSLTSKVRKLVVVPANQTPTVATVVHADTLHSQTFFANAKDGDKVIVYSAEKEAILYRPSTNQIVNIAPVSSGATASGQ